MFGRKRKNVEPPKASGQPSPTKLPIKRIEHVIVPRMESMTVIGNRVWIDGVEHFPNENGEIALPGGGWVKIK